MKLLVFVVIVTLDFTNAQTCLAGEGEGYDSVCVPYVSEGLIGTCWSGPDGRGPEMFSASTIPYTNPGSTAQEQLTACADACLGRDTPYAGSFEFLTDTSTPRAVGWDKAVGFSMLSSGRCFCEMVPFDTCTDASGFRAGSHEAYSFQCSTGVYQFDANGGTCYSIPVIPTTDQIVIGAGSNRPNCNTCDDQSQCGSDLFCGKPSVTDYTFSHYDHCPNDQTNTQKVMPNTLTVDLCADQCRGFSWVDSNGDLQVAEGFFYHTGGISHSFSLKYCYCESLKPHPHPECGTPGGNTDWERYSFDGKWTADYVHAHLYECNSAPNNADDQIEITMFGGGGIPLGGIDYCADQCRGLVWSTGGHKTAKGFIYKESFDGGPACYCESVHSDPHEDCSGTSGGLGTNSDWNRYDFIPEYAFMHYGYCTLGNGAAQIDIVGVHSIDTCAAACKGGVASSGVEALGFIYKTDGDCFCESVASYPHPDCPRNSELTWARYDFVNYSPVIDLKHTWYGTCQLGQVCTEISGDMYDNINCAGACGTGFIVNTNVGPFVKDNGIDTDDQHPMILLTDGVPTLLFGGMSSWAFKMIESDFNGNMLNKAYFDTQLLGAEYGHPNPGSIWTTMSLDDVTPEMWLNERKLYLPVALPTECYDNTYCMRDFKNPNGWNQADTGLTYSANVDTQCARVCQGALVGGYGAKGFEIEALGCTCKAEAAVAGTTCQALEGCKSYDFEIALGGVYESAGYCHPATAAYELFSTGQSGAEEDWLENCRAGCVAHTPTASQFTFDPTDGHCYCMQTTGGAHTEHPCETGTPVENPTPGFLVYTIWDGGVTDAPGCKNGGVDVRGLGVCVIECTASSDPSKDGSDGELYCINGGEVFNIIGSCGCACPDGVSGDHCEIVPDQISIGAGSNRSNCNTCNEVADCATGYTCGEPKPAGYGSGALDYTWAHQQECNVAGGEIQKTVTDVDDCATQCKYHVWEDSGTQKSRGFIYADTASGSPTGPDCYCEAQHSSPHPECHTLGGPKWDRYDFNGHWEADYVWAHHQQCNPSNNADKELIKTVTSIQDCADQCRGEVWATGAHRTAKGFIYRSRATGGPGCYCESVHSQPHEECGSLASPDWHRYDFIPEHAFMHYGYCTDGTQLGNAASQIDVAGVHSIDSCAAACKGQVTSSGIESMGFKYKRDDGDCYCESVASYPHADCPRNNEHNNANNNQEQDWSRWDFVNYSPVIELKHTWYGSCQLDQECGEITGDVHENTAGDGNVGPLLANDQTPMILVKNNEPTLLFGGQGVGSPYYKMVETDFNGNMLKTLYFDTRELASFGVTAYAMIQADVTLELLTCTDCCVRSGNAEPCVRNYIDLPNPLGAQTCTGARYCLQDFKNPNGWNQADTGLTYTASEGSATHATTGPANQCARVCQGAVVNGVGAKGFEVNGLECICKAEAAVAGTTCQALEGCKSYDFEIAAGGAYETPSSFCKPDPNENVYAYSSAQPDTIDSTWLAANPGKNKVDWWMDNCRVACLADSEHASHFTLQLTTGKCQCMQRPDGSSNPGKQTEHPCETGKPTIYAELGWTVYTIWDGGVTDVPTCTNGGVDARGLGVCVLECTASSDPLKDGSDGEFYCINGGHIFDVVESCVCICPDGFSGDHCEIIDAFDECSESPCLNGGTCTEVSQSVLGDYLCDCTAGFDGQSCQNRVCGTGGHQACLNSGYCFDDAVTLSKYGDDDCFCPSGYEGHRCERAAADTPCAGDYLGSKYKAQVVAGAAGEWCQKDVNGAVGSYTEQFRPYAGGDLPDWATTNRLKILACYRGCIQFDGLIQDPVTSYQDMNYWNTRDWWDSLTFTVRLGGNGDGRCYCYANAPVDGACEAGTGTYETSATEYYGFTIHNDCADIDTCTPDPCGGATCLEGKNTEDCDDCAHNGGAGDCLNGGTCTDGQGTYTCTCAPGYDGENCQNEVCSTGGHQACLNSGTCFEEDVVLGKYGDDDCFCPSGFEGHRCERETSPCDLPDAGSTYAKVGDGWPLPGWAYLPVYGVPGITDGSTQYGYPPLLTPGDPLYNPDRKIECMNRCLAADCTYTHFYTRKTVSTAAQPGIGQTGWGAIDTCACASSASNLQTPSDYDIFVINDPPTCPAIESNYKGSRYSRQLLTGTSNGSPIKAAYCMPKNTNGNSGFLYDQFRPYEGGADMPAWANTVDLRHLACFRACIDYDDNQLQTAGATGEYFQTQNPRYWTTHAWWDPTFFMVRDSDGRCYCFNDLNIPDHNQTCPDPINYDYLEVTHYTGYHIDHTCETVDSCYPPPQYTNIGNSNYCYTTDNNLAYPSGGTVETCYDECRAGTGLTGTAKSFIFRTDGSGRCYCYAAPAYNQLACEAEGGQWLTDATYDTYYMSSFCNWETCDGGFNTPDCDDCAHNGGAGNCLNGATCTDGQGTYTCTCAPGYDGENCQNEVCGTGGHQACLNSGTCFEQGVVLSKYYDDDCFCPSGFEGHRCEQAAANTPCPSSNYKGSKYSEQLLTGGTSEACIPADYDGTQRPYGNAADHPAWATTDDLKTLACFRACLGWPGYSQTDPNFQDTLDTDYWSNYQWSDATSFSIRRTADAFNGRCYCYATPLPVNGVCSTGVYTLKTSTYYGYNIDHECEAIDTCTPDPCGGATCLDGLNTPDCDDCAHNGGAGECLNGGTCTDGQGTFTCTCAPGYDGEICQNELCGTGGHQECRNGGTCFEEGVVLAKYGEDRCWCPSGEEGHRCERISPDTPCGVGEVYKGSFFERMTVGGACHKNNAPGYTGPNNYDYHTNQIRVYDGGNDLPTWATSVDLKLLAAFRACIDFDDNQISGIADAYNDPTNWVGRDWWTFQTFLTDSTSGRTYCYDILPESDGVCPTGYTFVPSNNAYTIHHNCVASVDTCQNDFCEIDTVNSPSMCLDGLNTPDCDDCNPCPDSHPFLGGPTFGTQYWCYTDINDHGQGICNMANSGVPPPVLNGVAQTWGANQPDCVVNTTLPSSVPCLNGGTCVDGVGTFSCACTPGFGGDRCETPLNCVASSNPAHDGQLNTSFYCDNNGTIGGIVGSCNCTCVHQFSGTNCDECAPGLGYNFSKGYHECETCRHGTVNNQTSHRAACAAHACDYGYGYTSDIATPDFSYVWDAANNSLNSGNCRRCPPDTESPDGDGQCVLCTTAGMEGLDCLVDTDECSPNNGSGTCLNGATCFDSNNYSFVPLTEHICNCTAGWKGDSCEIDIDECQETTETFSQLCNTTGSVSCNTDGGPNTRNCTCKPGYEGLLCEMDIDECQSTNNTNFPQLCNATGTDTCDTLGGINTRNCNCKPGYEGLLCDIDVDECASTNNSNFPALCDVTGTDTCDTLGGINTRNCNCKPGYEGLLCEIDIDECTSTNNTNFPSLCNVTGTDFCNTTFGPNTRNCTCIPGYEGDLCETDTNECYPDPCVYGTCTQTTDGVTAAINSFHCACDFGWIGTDCGTLEKKLELLAPEANIVSWVMVVQGVAVVLFLALGVRQLTPVQQLGRFVSGKPPPKSCCERFFEGLCVRRKASSVNRTVRYTFAANNKPKQNV